MSAWWIFIDFRFRQLRFLVFKGVDQHFGFNEVDIVVVFCNVNDQRCFKFVHAVDR